MVSDKGIKPSTAAKILKINSTTAKEMLKRVEKHILTRNESNKV